MFKKSIKLNLISGFIFLMPFVSIAGHTYSEPIQISNIYNLSQKETVKLNITGVKDMYGVNNTSKSYIITNNHCQSFPKWDAKGVPGPFHKPAFTLNFTFGNGNITSYITFTRSDNAWHSTINNNDEGAPQLILLSRNCSPFGGWDGSKYNYDIIIANHTISTHEYTDSDSLHTYKNIKGISISNPSTTREMIVENKYRSNIGLVKTKTYRIKTSSYLILNKHNNLEKGTLTYYLDMSDDDKPNIYLGYFYYNYHSLLNKLDLAPQIDNKYVDKDHLNLPDYYIQPELNREVNIYYM